MRVCWATAAVHDIRAIATWLETRSTHETANRVCRALYDTVALLALHPLLGKHGQHPGTREVIAGHYVIVYRLEGERVEILRLWHGTQTPVRH